MTDNTEHKRRETNGITGRGKTLGNTREMTKGTTQGRGTEILELSTEPPKEIHCAHLSQFFTSLVNKCTTPISVIRPENHRIH